jgi:GTP cyclohydrolase II
MPFMGKAIRPYPDSDGFRDLSNAGRPDDPREAARAIDAVRRGWPIRVVGAAGSLRLLAVEGASADALTAFAPTALLISGERAATLKLTNQLAAASPGPVRMRLSASATLGDALAIADPALDLAHPMKGPFRTEPLGAQDAASAAITLARLAHRLPAWYVSNNDGDCAVTVSTAAIGTFADPRRLSIAARARLPVAASEEGEIIAFRSPEDAQDHVALVIGRRDASAPVVRLHSECLTGDILGSLKCDCGPQLHAALHAMADAPWGILLYLRQEGRGIGLINKLRAYQLQDQGFDTVDANIRLGFPVEARDFGIAARMLALLSVNAVRLMTNNPEKVQRLSEHGIKVVERLPLALPANPHNEHYLATKRDRTGHQL